MDTLKNFAFGVVLIPPVPPHLGTSLTLATGHGARFPAPPFTVSVFPRQVPATPINAELLRVTAVAGDVLTIARTQEGSAPRTIEANDYIAQAMTQKFITDLVTELRAYTDAKVAAVPIPPPTTYVPPRVTYAGANPTPNADLHDMVAIFDLGASGSTQGNPLGTADEGQSLIYRIRDAGTAAALAWGSAYMSGAYIPLPTATVAYKTMHVGFRYNAQYGKWMLVALTQEP